MSGLRRYPNSPLIFTFSYNFSSVIVSRCRITFRSDNARLVMSLTWGLHTVTSVSYWFRNYKTNSVETYFIYMPPHHYSETSLLTCKDHVIHKWWCLLIRNISFNYYVDVMEASVGTLSLVSSTKCIVNFPYVLFLLQGTFISASVSQSGIGR